jgi:hypothetical protein
MGAQITDLRSTGAVLHQLRRLLAGGRARRATASSE